MNSRTSFKNHLNKRILFLTPYFSILLLLVVLPIVLIFVNAFSNITNPNFDSLELVKDQKTWVKIFRSLVIGVASAFICLLIAFPYSFFVARAKSKIMPIYALSLMFSPLIIFTIAKIYAIRGFFLSIVSTENNLNALWFMIFGLTYLNLPYMVMPLYSVFRDMPNNIIEASNDLGYGPIKTMFKIIVPYSSKAIISGLGIIFLASATTFVISDKLLPDGSQLQTIGAVINSYTNPSNQFEVAAGTNLVIVVSVIFIGTYSLINFLPKLMIRKTRGVKKYE
ncbi:ABC transporter permease [Mycoplasma tauri]|uniref:ABC transporter permease n=1 Tax=Mycoplasma tauri TaxID=547987 RepID=UPI0019687038|nr:ABC transporter permease subunit [Mycoplasma tauri]MBZ4218294.1 ABC transporter permease subunit [Mycoplasma tauri]QSB07814.1 ABC transporter permease subunit [Mycoplasma tauri]